MGTQGIVDHWSWSLNLVFFTVKGFWRGFAEWLFILGSYSMCREIFQKNYSWLPLLSQMCMPFYLTHQQILVAIASVALWVPSLPFSVAADHPGQFWHLILYCQGG